MKEPSKKKNKRKELLILLIMIIFTIMFFYHKAHDKMGVALNVTMDGDKCNIIKNGVKKEGIMKNFKCIEKNESIYRILRKSEVKR